MAVRGGHAHAHTHTHAFACVSGRLGFRQVRLAIRNAVPLVRWQCCESPEAAESVRLDGPRGVPRVCADLRSHQARRHRAVGVVVSHQPGDRRPTRHERVHVLPAPEGLQVPRAHREAGPADSILAGLLRAVDLEPSWGLRHDSCNSM